MKVLNIKYVSIGCIVLFFTMVYSGCIELEPEDNFIYVVVSEKTKVWGYDDIKSSKFYIPGMQIDMEIRKSGAVKKTGTFTTGDGGVTNGYIYHTVKVYKEQCLRVTGNLRTVIPQSYIDEGYIVNQFDYEELTWSQIKSFTDWGGTYSLSTTVELYVYKPI